MRARSFDRTISSKIAAKSLSLRICWRKALATERGAEPG
jgi:hypothetical protein